MAKRTITIELDVTDDQYADVANLAWMLIRALPYDGAVWPDRDADPKVLNDRWSQYETEARWA
jgi:hypothetical protein